MTIDDLELGERELFMVKRRLAHLTQAQVAEEAGTSQPYVSHWERGTEVERADKAGRGPGGEALWAALERLVARVAA